MYRPKDVPSDPGIYMMKDAKGEIIYIGKAKNMKKRIASYFSGSIFGKTRKLVESIADIEFVITDNEVESLILESKMIKKHQPKYNIMLKDTDRYQYIKFTDERYPRMIGVWRKDDKGKYFGPFVDGYARKVAMRHLQRLFGLRVCKTLPKKECLYYHIKRCSAPCIGNISQEEYGKNIKHAMNFLHGKGEDYVKVLENQMKELSSKMEFEKAKELRDRINALKIVAQKQKIDLNKDYCTDIFASVTSEDKIAISVFRIDKGIVTGRKQFLLERIEADSMASFLVEYYRDREIPSEIILEQGIEWQEELEKYLCDKREKKINLLVPLKGDKLRLVEMVQKNAKFFLEQRNSVLSDLQRRLRLPSLPAVIDCFDISTIQGTNTVASMVQFVDGSPNKQGYRRFKIKTIDGQDDFACLEEVIRRRYSKLGTEKAPATPDLIVIDGGKGQLSSAFSILDELGVKIPMIGLAKKEEEIFTIGLNRPIVLDKKLACLKLLQRIRDEAHRFAITYHRLLRSKSMVKSELDDIKGVGKATFGKLLVTFGSVDGVKNASDAELAKAVGKKMAQKVRDGLNQSRV